MPRYIKTDEFEKRIKPYDTNDPVDKALYNFAHNKMMDTSTADVVERKKGKWIRLKPQSGGYWQCSACGFPSEAFAAKQLYKFCPNCGADMREESDNG